jgi:predicted amidohydrolase
VTGASPAASKSTEDAPQSHNTALLAGRDGALVALYRKRFIQSDEPGIAAGRAPCVLDVPGLGRLAILICKDAERDDLLHEALAALADAPLSSRRLLLNPAIIQPSPGAKLAWSAAVASLARRWEEVCATHGVTLLRCDHRMMGGGGGLGTSIVVTPTHTVLCNPKAAVCAAFVLPALPHETAALAFLRPPERVRTERQDNTGNRFVAQQLSLASGQVTTVGLARNVFVWVAADGKTVMTCRLLQSVPGLPTALVTCPSRIVASRIVDGCHVLVTLADGCTYSLGDVTAVTVAVSTSLTLLSSDPVAEHPIASPAAVAVDTVCVALGERHRLQVAADDPTIVQLLCRDASSPLWRFACVVVVVVVWKAREKNPPLPNHSELAFRMTVR